jgi:transposase-like protein
MFTMPTPYPKEFREDVIRVARDRDPDVRLEDVAADFGISESCLNGWLKQADSSSMRCSLLVPVSCR